MKVGPPIGPRNEERRLDRRTVGVRFSIVLALILLVPVASAHATTSSHAGFRDASVYPFTAAVPRVLLLISNVNTLVPDNPTVWGMTVQFLLTNNDTESHEVVFSSHVNQSVNWTTPASNTSGSWFASPNVLADVTVTASSTIQFTITFPSPGTYQFVDRAYFNLPPYNSSGNVTVNSIPVTAAPSSDTDDATINATYLAGGIGIGLVVGAIVTALVLRRRK